MRCIFRAKLFIQDDWASVEDAFDWERNSPLEENVGNGDPRSLPAANDEEIPANLLNAVSTGSAVSGNMDPSTIAEQLCS